MQEKNLSMNEDFLTIEQAAELAGRSTLTIRRLIKLLLKQNNPEAIQMIKQKQWRGGFIYKVKEDLIRQKYNLPNQKSKQNEKLPKQKIKDDQATQKQKSKPNSKANVNIKVLEAKAEIINLLKGELHKRDHQIKTKDWQIGSLGKKIDNLIERGRESNIILKGLQDRVFMLEAPRKTGPKNEVKNEPKTKKRGGISRFFHKRIF